MSFDPKIYSDETKIIPYRKRMGAAPKAWVTVLQLLFLAGVAGIAVFFALTVFS